MGKLSESLILVLKIGSKENDDDQAPQYAHDRKRCFRHTRAMNTAVSQNLICYPPPHFWLHFLTSPKKNMYNKVKKFKKWERSTVTSGSRHFEGNASLLGIIFYLYLEKKYRHDSTFFGIISLGTSSPDNWEYFWWTPPNLMEKGWTSQKR